ncbi:adenine phosphoribosyltransferase [Marisediminicola sp. LYQ134]|uniref:adenine phosphoribosyltransferase n=1 Tax=unclassified Marisediminicola TaxID=2618316 RepID=UPI003983535A
MTTSARRFVHDLTEAHHDFPSAGVLFRDLTPVFASAAAFAAVIDELSDGVSAPSVGDPASEPIARVDAIAGVEARGFLLAAATAYKVGAGLLALRKPGKLPGELLAETFDLEYGSASLELQPGRLPAGSRVRLLDDVLATGGTLLAAVRLLERAGYEVESIAVVVEIDGLGGREVLDGYPVSSITTL